MKITKKMIAQDKLHKHSAYLMRCIHKICTHSKDPIEGLECIALIIAKGNIDENGTYKQNKIFNKIKKQIKENSKN